MSRGRAGGCGPWPRARSRPTRTSRSPTRRPGSGHRAAAPSRLGGAAPGRRRTTVRTARDDGRLVVVRSGPGTSAATASVRPRPVGHRQVGVDAALEDVRLAVDRDRVVDPGRDARGREVGDDRVAILADVDRVLVEDVGPADRRDRGPDGQVREGLVVAAPRSPAGGPCCAPTCRTGTGRWPRRGRSAGSCSRGSRGGSARACPGCGTGGSSRPGGRRRW